MHKLLLSVFKRLEQENIRYCLMRDYDQLDQFTGGGEIDLLVQHNQLSQLRGLLAQLGFVSLPNWGYAPHYFFLAYEEDSDSWLKLDVVTEIAYGKPIPALRTTLAVSCLNHRQRREPTFIPSPEEELITLLLHCVLDKGHFSPSRSQRLQSLRRQVTDESHLSTLLAAFWLPSMTWPQMAALIDDKNWTALLSKHEAVAAHLARGDTLGTIGRQVGDRVRRKVSHWLKSRGPRSLTVAILAPDGAGKSTLAAGIQDSFYFPVRSIYMGLYQKGKAGSMLWRLPGLAFAARLGGQWRRYLSARYHQARGRLVIFDRYSYDALLPPAQPLNWLKRVRRWLLAHTCPAPDLMLMLDAPGEVLYARKGEHSPVSLERQRQAYLKLQSRLPQMVVIDATRDAEYVRRKAISLIWRGCLGRQVGLPPYQAIETTGTKGNFVNAN